ncbi:MULTISPECIES: hypothetical protein [Paenibacillus]|uniref:Uncharacterized protein n=1 Tax=Paenibacillus albilobatus TaxID=2716884 RepID=A0A920CCI2_9BACL|nr:MULTISPECIES: hypothetical protein [Paenibacillus]GIO34600.1 hypothetical protein J2TS6_57410 [Paenibacillus albilobatus]
MMIRNIEYIESVIANFTIRQIEWLSDFHFYITQDKFFENISILDITFLIKESSKTYELVIRFSNVESLKFQSGGALTLISGFNIRDLKDHGYHPMNYLIEDYENGIINFYCNDIEFVSLKESENITI